jgi:hypothetical protein
VNGDTFPAIRRTKQIKHVPFQTYQFLRAHVVALTDGTDSDLQFKFRLHYKPTKGKKKSKKRHKSGRGPGSKKQKTTVESDPIEVSQALPQKIQWNLSDISEEVLRSVRRVEIAWYHDDYEPVRGPRGRNKGDFEYQGLVIVDNIRLLKSDPDTSARKVRNKETELRRTHGMIVDRVFEERTGNLERGTLVYSDGAEIPYEYEILDDGGAKYTIDGETFETRVFADE